MNEEVHSCCSVKSQSLQISAGRLLYGVTNLHSSPYSNMAATAVRNKNVISLKGSAVLVAEYFNYAVNR
jgi:hypothetical protein